MCDKNEVSSANVPVVVLLVVRKSDIQSIYSIGPGTLPWRTPDLTGRFSDTFVFTRVLNCNTLCIFYGIPLLSAM